MDFWTPNDFQAITHGRWLVPPTDPRAAIAGVGIDTRTLRPGQAFFAVKGDTHDGHDHVAQAIEKGAAVVVVSKSEISNPKSQIRNPKSPPILLVADTVLALQQLARVWRDILKQRGIRVIAVTGSSGKTTTRNLIHTALSATLRGTQSPKSFNNHLGVPLTLLAAGIGAGRSHAEASIADANRPENPEHFVVAEVGTNHRGEIAALASMLRPDIAVITNIGHAHIGHFGSQEAIAEEKSSLLKFLQPGGVAVVNGSQPWTEGWCSLLPIGVRMSTFRAGPQSVPARDGGDHSDPLSPRERAGVRAGEPGASAPTTTAPTPTGQQITCTNLRTDAAGLHFTVTADKHNPSLPIDLPMLGVHNADNALVAIAVARELGVPDGAIAAALAQAKGVEMRMELVRIGHAHDDASVRANATKAQGSPALTPALSQGERGPERSDSADAESPRTSITVINDAYNANPDSMAAAVATLVSLPAPRRVAILADMLELGDASVAEHARLGRLLAGHVTSENGIGLVILIGEAMGHAAGELAAATGPRDATATDVVAGETPAGPGFLYVPRFSDDLPQRVANLLRDGDVVLLKGSRGLRLERLLPAMTHRFESPAPQLV